MTKKDFFRLLIKTVAIYWSIVTIYSVITLIFSFYEGMRHGGEDFYYITILPLTVVLVVGIILFLIIKYTDGIIKLLRLDKGFDDEQIIIGNFNAQKWAQFAIIILGGLLFIENLSGFLTQSVALLKQQMSNHQQFEPNRFIEIRYYTQIVSLVVGYLFISNNRAVARFLTK